MNNHFKIIKIIIKYMDLLNFLLNARRRSNSPVSNSEEEARSQISRNDSLEERKYSVA